MWLPNDGDVDALLAALDAETFAAVGAPRQGQLWLPRFKVLNSSRCLTQSDVIRRSDVCATQLDWGFTDVLGLLGDMPQPLALFGHRLVVDSIHHKAVVSIDETGSEAAAVTVVALATCARAPAPPTPPFSVRADRPFLFAIEHRRLGPLFVGKLMSMS